MSITLRDVSAEDGAFLRKVYACTRALELSMVPWNEEQRAAFLQFQFDAQDSYYRAQYPDAAYQIILNEGTPVGRLYVSRQETEIRILDITVLPEYRSAGIGTSLIRGILTEAEANQQSVTIWIEQFNPSQAMFQRFGFQMIQEDGYNHLLEYRPPALRDSAAPA
jgi:ribosomal protein S18 acetylase RimI-like enzyme